MAKANDCTELKTEIKFMEKQLNKLELDFKEIMPKLTRIEVNLSNLIDTVKNHIVHSEKNISETNDKIDKLETKQNTMSNRIENFGVKIGGILFFVTMLVSWGFSKFK